MQFGKINKSKNHQFRVFEKNSESRNCRVWAFERNSDSKEPLGFMKEPAKTRQVLRPLFEFFFKNLENHGYL
jgi:hypothetical protein